MSSLHSVLPVASFAVPARMTAIEGDPVAVCVQMLATPATSVLGQDVVVGVSTIDGTGKHVFIGRGGFRGFCGTPL